ncbi:hypothetical protein CH260_23835 [Rhodococcus sp. 05-2256-B2]|uniref:hypothetical protein n=1 Tax=Nocardiaceae TaxID=85025 RepID=UPI00050C69DD|nr:MULTISPECIES: hypothetical protein [Rhodococcus]MBY4382090.1 hypothetical protein [Rhodococcus fascians]MBY4396959.1 hypothetical protein [Rhodococcus fascians]MBY4405779.1 hypothetical protein [Rhodococcus fascians]MBY4421717.1 hypothetical protein [Rhodococcus fascians]MBY4461013.1 hypothetical protein [Rhodococcus fascians]
MKIRTALTSAVIAAVISSVSVQVASAAPVAAAPSSSAPAAASSEEVQVENLAAAFSALERMPQDLQQRAPSDPEVQAWIQNNISDPARPGGVVTPQFNPFSCAAAIADFAIGVGFPAAKIIRIAREAGGFTKFARYVFDFVRGGTFPAEASDELIELLGKVTGVGGLVACL